MEHKRRCQEFINLNFLFEIKKICCSLILSLVFLCCSSSNSSDGDDSPTNTDIKVSNISVTDFGNNADASDISISFVKPTSTLNFVESFRVFVVPSSSTSNFNTSVANTQSGNTYTNLSASTQSTSINLSPTLKDINNSDILEDVSYSIFILSIGIDTENQLSDPSITFELSKNNLVKTLVGSIDGGSGGMAIDTDGNIYMADFGQTLAGQGNKVFKIGPSGLVSIFATGLNGASGNDFDSQGNLFQSNINAQSISKITPDGTVSSFTSGSPIVNTVGISINENNDLFVVDCDGHQLLKVNTNGNISVYSNSNLFNCPNGITRDDSNNLYVSNFYDGNVLKITPLGDVSILATLPGNNNGHVTYNGGFLYVIARSANQIYKVSLSGDVELLAGSGQRGSNDGPALEASFSLPNDLVFSNDGSKIYLNDVIPTSGNNIAPCKIRVIELAEE